MLSQSEIDALLKSTEGSAGKADLLSNDEKDAIGEISNISMGTAATALYTLISKKVTITAPEVIVTSLRQVSEQYPLPFVAVEVSYTKGLKGANLLIISESDVKVITDLIMGGDGTNTTGELSEMHLSAIGEAMNQMIGSSCTSMSSMLNKSIDISPPNAFLTNFTEEIQSRFFDMDEKLVKVRFRLEVAGLIDSFIMQFMPLSFAKEIIDELVVTQEQVQIQSQPPQVQPVRQTTPTTSGTNYDLSFYDSIEPQKKESNVNVAPLSFREFEDNPRHNTSKENIDLILDVPLQISVELGKVKKLVREILELSQGSIVELDKMAGEPVDILVNGKMIAKGEVVVIEDSFGVRITEILSPEKRVLRLGK